EASMGKINEVLLQSYPNPFTKFTSISYQLPANGKVSLRIYDISGRLVKTLADETKEAGCYTTAWNTKGISNGVYFCKLEYNSRVLTSKLILVK
ncbi:MAG: T9SS type A sorting domain-containing protein, partial [bacterium]|nr:T9SS type A sorting domain-containing protein [bacterium]